MTLRPAAVLMPIGLVLTALVACGGEGPSPEPPTGGFRSEANAVCEEQWAAYAEVFQRSGYTASREENTRNLADRNAVSREFNDRLDEVGAPAGQARRFEQFVASRRRATAAREDLVAAQQAGGARAIAAADATVGAATVAQNRLAEELGLAVCAQALAPAAERRVEQVVERALTSPLPSVCEQAFTANFLEEALGGARACRRIPAGRLADSVHVQRVSGSAGEFASIDVTVSGGPDDGSRLNLRLLYEGGRPVIFDQLRLFD